jgi:hypothetical protein
MSVSYECCVLSGRGLCDGLVTRPEESYRVWCVCDREASIVRRSRPPRGCRAIKKVFKNIFGHLQCYYKYYCEASNTPEDDVMAAVTYILT